MYIGILPISINVITFRNIYVVRQIHIFIDARMYIYVYIYIYIYIYRER